MKYTKTVERCASGDENLTENFTDTTCTSSSTRTLHSSSGVVCSVTEVSSTQQNKKSTQTLKDRHNTDREAKTSKGGRGKVEQMPPK